MSNPLRPCLLVYDIPDAADLANPTPALRGRGVRVNLSCWVVPEDRIPYHLLAEMERRGATWHVVRFADDQLDKLVAMARATITKHMAEAERRAAQSAERA